MTAAVVEYYGEKTERILRKYGPGPRIHFHTGLEAQPPRENATLEEIRAAMVEAQERLVARLDVPSGSRVLDVGCGLGGTALYLAELAKAEVTAITIVPEHVALTERFARDAGVERRVTALCCDAHTASSAGRFEMAIAVESSCYLNRAVWFKEMARALVPGARLVVVDCFADHPAVVARFDGYWRTKIGTVDEYGQAARDAGFACVEQHVWNKQVLGFWPLSRAWNRLARADASGAELTRLSASIEEHAWLEGCMRIGSIRYAKMVYERR